VDHGARAAYLTLLEQTLTRALVVDEGSSGGRRRRGIGAVLHALATRGYVVVPDVPAVADRAVKKVPGLPGSRTLIQRLAKRRLVVVPDADGERFAAMRAPASGRGPRAWDRTLARTEREFGLDWPEHAETMAGLRRLDNVRTLVEDVLERGVPGDLIETGVWRGGTTIFMRALLAAHDDPDRVVWVADSFQGLPKPDAATYPADEGLDYTGHAQLSVGAQHVRANFARYGLLDERVRLLQGWFKDTLPDAPIDRLAVMRLDGDLYESTMDALEPLYPKLSVGGYCIIDDYGALDACRRAVDDYRAAHGITEPIVPIDWTGAYWKRERA